VIYINDKTEGMQLQNGILADIAPTLLFAMGLDIPESMTGKVLIGKNKT